VATDLDRLKEVLSKKIVQRSRLIRHIPAHNARFNDDTIDIQRVFIIQDEDSLK
jgi:hypothetical protein